MASPVFSSCQVYSIDPESMLPLLAKIPIIAFVVTDFPEPDSPTIATVSPLYKSKLTPLIALTLPFPVLKDIVKSLIFNILSLSIDYISFIVGSKASLNPSPNKLKLNINTDNTTAGINIIYG